MMVNTVRRGKRGGVRRRKCSSDLTSAMQDKITNEPIYTNNKTQQTFTLFRSENIRNLEKSTIIDFPKVDEDILSI